MSNTEIVPITGEWNSRNDSETLARVYGQMGYRQINPIRNSMTGLGTERDPNSYFQVAFTTPIPHQERINLFRNSRIAKNIVMIYPEEASWFNASLGSQKYASYGLDAQRVNTYLDNLKTGSLEQKVRIASMEARLHGEGWVLLGINDGQRFDQPINEENIQSFEWAEVFPYNKVKPDEYNPELYIVELIDTSSLPKSVMTESESTNYRGINKLTVHQSRLRLFIGDFNPPSILEDVNKHESSLQAAFDGLAIALQGIQASNAMLQDYSLFWYKLDGLANMVRAKKYDEIYSRFLTLQMSKSVLKGIAMDAKNEDAGFIQRNYGGVKDILEVMIDYMVAESGMVRYKVLGTANRAGLGAEGRGLQDRLEHSLKIKSWQKFCWKDNLVYMARLALLAKDSPTKGKLPKSLTITFPPVLELTPEEISSLMEKNVNWAKNAKDAGFIEPLEARVSLFGNPEVILNPHIMLDERVTDMMDQQLEEKLEQADEPIEVEPDTAVEPTDELDPDQPIDSVEEEIGIPTEDADLLAPSITLTREDEANINTVFMEEIENLESWRTYYDEQTGEWKEDGSYPFLVWFSDADGENKHRTPIAVRVTANNAKEARSKAIAAARKKCTRHCAVAYGARKPTKAEMKTAANGGWIRTGAKGQKAGYGGLKGVGARKKDAKEDKLSGDELKRVNAALKKLAEVTDEQVRETLKETE